jgi:hypothetical protein
MRARVCVACIRFRHVDRAHVRDDGPEVFAAKSIAAHSTALDKVNARAYGSFRSFVEDIDLIVRNALAYRRDCSRVPELALSRCFAVGVR